MRFWIGALVGLLLAVPVLGCAGAPAAVGPAPAGIPAEAVAATVRRVIDGDTLEVTLDDRTEKVRLIGVDTPEVHGGAEPFGPEASAFTKEALPPGTAVYLEQDAGPRDRYGRLLAYLWLADGTMFNETLLRAGYAQILTIPPNVKYADRLRAAQQEAREAGRGLWGTAASSAGQPDAAAEAPAGAAPPGPRYDPNGPDRDCSDFATRAEAQAFFTAAGGPGRDPHRLDQDHDGLACESLP